MDTKKLVVVGCTRDSAHYIRGHVMKLYAMKCHCKEFKMIIFENDSKDTTSAILRDLAAEHKDLHIITEKGVKGRIRSPLSLSRAARRELWTNSRTSVLAYGRNRLIQQVERMCSDWDYMLVADLDDVISRFSIQNFKNIFQYKSDTWDVLTANSIGPYYDIWALRTDKRLWSAKHSALWPYVLNFDCWDMVAHQNARINTALCPADREVYRRDPLKYRHFLARERRKAVRRYIVPYQVIIPVTTGLIPVVSAFGGMGIYRISKITGCRYRGVRAQCDCRAYGVVGPCRVDQCEHVAFHKEMIKKYDAKIFICSNFLLPTSQEHVVRPKSS